MDSSRFEQQARILLLTTARSYRNSAFVTAAERLGIDTVLAVDMPKGLSRSWPEGFGIDFSDVAGAVAEIAGYHEKHPLQAILPVDDSGSILAATAAASLGLPHNSANAAMATRDKFALRELLGKTRLNSPRFHEYRTGSDPKTVINKVGFPCVVKPRNLNGSRGVIRANNRQELDIALKRTARLVKLANGLAPDSAVSLLIESYIPGQEVALEGIMDNGKLDVFALFDKPDPLDGPFFEETIYTTPSRLPAGIQEEIIACTAEAAASIGLTIGPVHAELRVNDDGPWIIEIAGRSIGGLCSRTLQFGTQGTLEEIILRQACGIDYQGPGKPLEARGVMMIPIPAAGLLRSVDGLDKATAIAHIDDIEITAPLNNPLIPLPEGDGYLGFIFAKGPTPELVESALRKAHDALAFRIDPLLPVLQSENMLLMDHSDGCE
jgi:hypothetical protein